VVPKLLSAGYQVTGLARSEAAAKTIAAMGADVSRGDIDDIDGRHAAAAAADGVIHVALKHDLMQVGDMSGTASGDFGAIKGHYFRR